MANNVSDVSVKLSTDPQQFIRGFETARASVAPLAGAINNLNSSLTSFNFGGFAARFTSLAGPLQNLAANAMARNIPGMAVDSVNLAAALASIGSESLRTAASQMRMADMLGVTQEGFQGLNILATRTGIELEDITQLVSKFNGRIGEMRQAFARGEVSPLVGHLRVLGIEAERFSRMTTGDQLKELARGLETVSNAQSRRFLLGQFFGEREATTAMRLLGRGAEPLIDAETEAVRRGLVLYGERRQAVEDAARAQRELNAEIENSWNAFGRELGVRTAPAAKAAAESLRPGTPENEFWLSYFGVLLQQRRQNPIPAETLDGLTKPRGLERLVLRRSIQERRMREGLASELGGNLNPQNRAPSEAVGDQIANAMDPASLERIAQGTNLLADLRMQFEAIGRSASEIRITRTELEAINPVLAQQIREQEMANELRQRQVSQAQQIRQAHQAAQPLEVLRGSIRDAYNNPMLSNQQRQFNAFQAIQQLESSLPQFRTQYAGALRSGSAEAVSAITQARAQQMDSEMSPQQRLATIMERAANSQERLERLMQQYFSALGSQGIAVAPEVR